ncbi:MAG: hypothetical protein FWD38_06165 [Oscillospiraceae bacterium]|nr:hypothetical protein [Oscillospiraceae bacterium]
MDKREAKLIKYKTKNEMIPTFFSGVFLSGAINILTTESARDCSFKMISMLMMFATCGLFFWQASKTHELQVWINSEPEDIRDDDEHFLNNTIHWDFWKFKNAYKIVLLIIPKIAWFSGLLSLVIFWFSSELETVLTLVNAFMCNFFNR